MNIGVDRPLEMIPVKPGESIKILRREAIKDIGSQMVLTFLAATSEQDSTGTRILLGNFKIPDLTKSK